MANKHPVLTSEKRTVLGKAVKKLRREGKLPANVYGKDLASTAIQIDTKAFEDVFKQVGETGLVDLTVDGETRPVLVKNLQLKYPLRTPLHVDFYQVNLKEKVKTMVPLEITGEPKAVTDKVGILIQQITEVEVEALPANLPEKIEVNVADLALIGDQVIVSQLPIPQDVTVLTEPEQIVAKIEEPVVEEPEPEVEVPAEGEEGAIAPEGEEGAEGEGETESKEGKEEKPDAEKGEKKKE